MEEQTIERVELGAWEWMGAVAQKITMARLRVIDHRDIPEEDIPLLKFLFQAHYDGIFPIYENKLGAECQTVSQADLFTTISATSSEVSSVTYGRKEDIVIETYTGKEVDKLGKETKKEEK